MTIGPAPRALVCTWGVTARLNAMKPVPPEADLCAPMKGSKWGSPIFASPRVAALRIVFPQTINTQISMLIISAAPMEPAVILAVAMIRNAKVGYVEGGLTNMLIIVYRPAAQLRIAYSLGMACPILTWTIGNA